MLDLKYKAHLGDALATLFARTLFMRLVEAGEILNKEKYFVHSHRVVSNAHFAKTAKEIKLFDELKSLNNFDNSFIGTRYEAAIYDVYSEKGFDEAFNFFRETAYKIYLDEYKILGASGAVIVY